MPRPTLPRPTDGELSILRVLWRLGPSNVRQVAAGIGHDPGYTTVLKQLQIMTEKRLVRRDDRERTHVFAAALREEETQRQLLDDLMERAFAGSAQQLVMRALSGRKPTAAELAELRGLIDSLEPKRK